MTTHLRFLLEKLVVYPERRPLRVGQLNHPPDVLAKLHGNYGTGSPERPALSTPRTRHPQLSAAVCTQQAKLSNYRASVLPVLLAQHPMPLQVHALPAEASPSVTQMSGAVSPPFPLSLCYVTYVYCDARKGWPCCWKMVLSVFDIAESLILRETKSNTQSDRSVLKQTRLANP